MNLRTYLRIKTAAKDPMWAAKAEAAGINRYNDLMGSPLPPVEVRDDPIQEMKHNLAAIRLGQGFMADDNAASGGYLPYAEWHDKYGTEPTIWGKLQDLENRYPSLMGARYYEPPAEIKDEYDRLTDDAMLYSDLGDYAAYANKNKK